MPYNSYVARDGIEVKVDLLGERMSINVPPVPMKVCGPKDAPTQTYLEEPPVAAKPKSPGWLSALSAGRRLRTGP